MAGRKNRKPVDEIRTTGLSGVQIENQPEDGREQSSGEEVTAEAKESGSSGAQIENQSEDGSEKSFDEEQEDMSDKQPEKVQGYHIICRNKITKNIGGVDFTDGIGHTEDAYTASWFAAKEGYKVKEVG